MSNFGKNLLILLAVMLHTASAIAFFSFPQLANAALICREVNTHKVCILSIERSAKNYWEYRASVQIDHQIRPVEIYDCQKSTRIDHNGNEISFESDGVLEFICGFFKK
jgi:hypothetical protein